MATKSRYPRGDQFPNEGFVQRAIEAHFSKQGFKPETEGHSDLVCVHPTTSERWVIEAKGESKGIGLDFRTGLGQLIQHMADPSCHYAMAVPNIPQFVKQCRAVSPWVRKTLHLHWLLVEGDGTVRTYGPEESP